VIKNVTLFNLILLLVVACGGRQSVESGKLSGLDNCPMFQRYWDYHQAVISYNPYELSASDLQEVSNFIGWSGGAIPKEVVRDLVIFEQQVKQFLGVNSLCYPKRDVSFYHIKYIDLGNVERIREVQVFSNEMSLLPTNFVPETELEFEKIDF